MAMQVEVSELSGSRLDAVRPALAAIYENSFPADEREAFATTFDGAASHTVLGAFAQGDLVGFADVFGIGNREVLLRYLAVSEQHRSHGIGATLLAEIAQRWRERADRLIFEVESPPDAPDAGLAARRIGFYERWGAHQVRCIDGYFYPSTLDISQALPVLLFEWHPAGECLSACRLRDTLRRLYHYCYGAEAAGYHLDNLLSRVIC